MQRSGLSQWSCAAKCTSWPGESARVFIPVSGMRSSSGWKERLAEADLTESTLKQAAWWFQSQSGSLRKIAADEGPTGDLATWFRRVLHRLPRSAYQGKASAALHEIWSLVESQGDRPPDGLDPSLLPPTDEIVRTIELRQEASGLVARVRAFNDGMAHVHRDEGVADSLTPPGPPFVETAEKVSSKGHGVTGMSSVCFLRL